MPVPRTAAARRLSAIALWALLSGLAPVRASDVVGPEALTPFKAALMDALRSGLEAGPAAAVEHCRLVAPTLPAAQATGGLLVGRTSDRLRNPANAPPPWLAPRLEALLAQAEDDAWQGAVVHLEDGRDAWVEPIRIAGTCLSCHGESVAPRLEAVLRARYPQDAARGYALGDVRGLFWVVPTPTSPR